MRGKLRKVQAVFLMVCLILGVLPTAYIFVRLGFIVASICQAMVVYDSIIKLLVGITEPVSRKSRVVS